MITVQIGLQFKMSDSEVQDILEGECKLLCQGYSYKIVFDALATNKRIVSISSA